ncbi:MAG: hypothetical protein NT166_15565 [Candidatus Aminicenantes bacterium]|nr:hypothetical protein [Candidatus Aminicenantes bacterium]
MINDKWKLCPTDGVVNGFAGRKKDGGITGFPPKASKTSPPGAASIYHLSFIIYNL